MIERIFPDESSFLAAADKFSSRYRRFTVSRGTERFWVYAHSRDMAVGMVARKLNLLEVAKHNPARRSREAKVEEEVLELFDSLPPDLQEKVKKHLRNKSE